MERACSYNACSSKQNILSLSLSLPLACQFLKPSSRFTLVSYNEASSSPLSETENNSRCHSEDRHLQINMWPASHVRRQHLLRRYGPGEFRSRELWYTAQTNTQTWPHDVTDVHLTRALHVWRVEMETFHHASSWRHSLTLKTFIFRDDSPFTHIISPPSLFPSFADMQRLLQSFQCGGGTEGLD